MGKSVGEIAEFLGGRVLGDARVVVTGVASLASARSGDLVFVEDLGGLDGALGGAASVVLAGEFASEFAGGVVGKGVGAGKGVVDVGKSVVVVEHSRLAFARVVDFLVGRDERSGVDVSAVVDASAVIGVGSWVGAGAVVGAGVVIGVDCRIYPRVVLYPGVVLGDRVVVHAGAVLGSDGFGYVRDAASGSYVKFPQIGSLRVGDDVEIGANSTIDRGALDATVIGRGSKIDNLVHIGHNVVVGEDVVIAAQTGVSGSSVIGNGVVVGGQVGIGDHVRVEDGVILGAQSGVPSRKVVRGKGVVFWGTPARPLQEYLKGLAELSRLGKKG